MSRRKSQRQRRADDLEIEEMITDARSKILKLRQVKSSAKASFTRTKHKLLELTESESVKKELCQDLKQKFTDLQKNLVEIFSELSIEYGNVNDFSKQEGMIDELDRLNEEFNAVMNRINEHNTSVQSKRMSAASKSTRRSGQALSQTRRMESNEELVRNRHSTHQSEDGVHGPNSRIEDWVNESTDNVKTGNINVDEKKQQIGADLWKQLKRVSIPVFSGDKKNYDSWKAAFDACVDQAPATPEYKLLQLRQYLSGEALRAIEGLGHSKFSYEAAKERLERKFGGTRRKVLKYLDDLDNFRPIREDCPKDIERFADLLDIAVTNLEEANRVEELGDGVFYHKLQKKFPERLLSRYKRWAHEQRWSEDVKTLRKFVNEEAEFQVAAAETLNGLRIPNKSKNQNGFFGNDSISRRRADKQCIVCKQSHRLWSCSEFKDQDVSKRWELAKKYRLCFKCMNGNHMAKDCRSSRICGLDGCTETHNRLLHKQKESVSARKTESSHEEEVPPQQTSHTTALKVEPDFISLRTVPVVLKNGKKKIVVNALLDDGSTKTYINSDVAAELGLSGISQKVTVNKPNGQAEMLETTPVEFQLQSIDGRVDTSIEAFTVKRVTGKLKRVNWTALAKKWKHLKDVRFPSVGPKPIIDILIGVDYAELHCAEKEIRGEPNEPIGRLTPLGWTCIGGVDRSYYSANFVMTQHSREELDDVNETIRRLWEIEDDEDNSSQAMSPDDKNALQIVTDSLKYEDGRYEVKIPWKVNKETLENNYSMAINRLNNTEKRLMKDKELGEVYSKTIDDYLKKGYIEEVEDNNKTEGWYLPHFPVLRPEKATTKVRVVFDGAAKFKGTSLNDAIHQGPKLQQDLLKVLTRFRRFPVAVVCDIAEMYLQVGIHPEDRKYQRFLWRNLDAESIPKVFQFTRMVFGMNSSPFGAQFVSQEHAKRNESSFPMAAESVLKSTYMDDTMDSTKDDKKGVQLYKELSSLWGSAGMYARKWLSNSTAVLQSIPEEDRAGMIDLDAGDLPSVKTLGIVWNAKEDVFTYHSIVKKEDSFTKRILLKRMATLFDPLGFISPYIIRIKVVMQELWIHGLDWDTAIPDQQNNKVTSWFEELKDLSMVKVLRCLQKTSKVIQRVIHVFTDASSEAYGAVIYQQCIYEDDTTSTRFVMSKSRVSPLKSTSIPRLELLGAVIGLKMAVKITESMYADIKKVIFWSDSMNVLWWIRNQSRKLKPFVANRIGQIQSITSSNQWRYVPTKSNPADLLTRGSTIKYLVANTTWWNGPSFLNETQVDWPENKFTPTEQSMAEMKQNVITMVTRAERQIDVTTLVGTSQYSQWNKLVAILSWIKRFINNCCLPKEARTNQGELQPEELEETEKQLIVEAQRESFTHEYANLKRQQPVQMSSKIISLLPQLDKDSILRANGRLQNAEYLPYDVKHPIILPRDHDVTKLIVRQHHEDGCHAIGTNHLLSKLSEKFWIVRAREVIRKVENECVVCKQLKARAAQQVMAPLPAIRLKTPLKAFARIGVDYAGPFLTIQGRGKMRAKRYLSLFTCLLTRAVHLEMAYSLDTDSFPNAFYRMTNRRGLPQEVLSDNGTNFVGGNNELKELVNSLDKKKIGKSTANKGIRWHFNAPLGPHLGGVFETMIKAAKRATYKILGNADIRDEELHTAFTGAESLLNSRPLTYQSTDIRDDVPLTPNHLLIGQVGERFAPDSVDKEPFSPRKRWRRVQELIRHYWKRWMREWLPTLTQRKKWTKEKSDLKEGDVVIVISPETPRGKWPLGRVMKVYPGRDGHVRVASVKIGEKEYTRPISRLCLIEV